jgi:hypothetical protein
VHDGRVAIRIKTVGEGGRGTLTPRLTESAMCGGYRGAAVEKLVVSHSARMSFFSKRVRSGGARLGRGQGEAAGLRWRAIACVRASRFALPLAAACSL